MTMQQPDLRNFRVVPIVQESKRAQAGQILQLAFACLLASDPTTLPLPAMMLVFHA
jgi:hypothetical protein